MQEQDCAFCRIARGQDRTAVVVCEGDSWIAFFPVDPATPGHTLVIPREHIPDVWSLGDKLGAELMSAVVRVGRAIRTAVSPAGLNLISSSGEAAEQSVFHLHLHIVPRYKDDEIDAIWPPKAPMDEAIKKGVAQRVRAACAGA